MRYQRRRGLGSRRDREGTAEEKASEPAPGGDATGRRSPWLRAGIAALVLLLCVAAGYLVAARWIFAGTGDGGTSDVVEVPELVGLTDENARERLEAAGLDFQVSWEVSHPRATAGAILSQEPLPGQLARLGAPVSVTRSTGSRRQRVPDVRGLSGRQAEIVLERLGFRIAIDTVRSPADRGRVVDTRPDAGTEATLPGEVQLQVSQGPSVMTVPDLAGRHVDDVSELLEEADLRLGPVEYDSEAFEAPGRVIGQSPPASYRLRAGGEVSILVSGAREELDDPPGSPGDETESPGDTVDGGDEADGEDEAEGDSPAPAAPDALGGGA